MNNQTATAINYEKAASELARLRLLKYPSEQAETIAKHYVAHAVLALDLLKMIEARRQSDEPGNLDWAIAYSLEQIKRNHLHDFGIALEW